MAEELKWSRQRKDLEWKECAYYDQFPTLSVSVSAMTRLPHSHKPLAVAYLESMGLPKPMLTVTRKQVEQGKLDFASSLEWQMYSRHDKPTD